MAVLKDGRVVGHVHVGLQESRSQTPPTGRETTRQDDVQNHWPQETVRDREKANTSSQTIFYTLDTRITTLAKGGVGGTAGPVS